MVSVGAKAMLLYMYVQGFVQVGGRGGEGKA